MQARCDVVASIFARRAEVLGSIPAAEAAFFAGLLLCGFPIYATLSPHNHGVTDTDWGNHARQRVGVHTWVLIRMNLEAEAPCSASGLPYASEVAQWLARWLMTQRSVDRKHVSLLHIISQQSTTKQDE